MPLSECQVEAWTDATGIEARNAEDKNIRSTVSVSLNGILPPPSLIATISKPSAVSHRWHHPSATVQRRLLLAVVRPQISTSPSADRASATALNVGQCFVCAELVNRRLAVMVTGPVAFTLAIANRQGAGERRSRTEAMVTSCMIRTLSQTMSAFGGKADIAPRIAKCLLLT